MNIFIKSKSTSSEAQSASPVAPSPSSPQLCASRLQKVGERLKNMVWGEKSQKRERRDVVEEKMNP